MADRLRRLPVRRLAELISAAAYGSVLVVAALSVISGAQVSAGYGLELIAGVGVATWIAHLFAELLGGHVSRQRPLERTEVLAAVVDGSPILASTVLPACALLLGRLNLVDDASARTIAVIAAVGQLLALGVIAGHLAPARRSSLWVFGAITVGIGVSVVAINVRLGH